MVEENDLTSTRLSQNYTQVDSYKLFWHGKDSRQREHHDTHTTRRENSGSDYTNPQLGLKYRQVPSRLTMPRNRTETRDECNFEATISYDPCQAGVRDFCPFKLFSSRPTAIFESAIQKSVLFSNGNLVCGRTKSFRLHPERCQRRRFQIQSTSPTPAHIILQQFHVQRAKGKGLRTSNCIMKRVILREEMR